MNKLDRLKVSLAEAGYTFHPSYEGNSVGWVATKWLLADYLCEDVCLQIKGTSHYLSNGVIEDLVVAKISGSIPGMSKYTRTYMEMRDFTPDEFMPNLQRIAKTLTEAFKTAEKEWSK